MAVFTLDFDAILTKVYEKANILLNAVQIIHELNFMFHLLLDRPALA